jgi:hypothetical protein
MLVLYYISPIELKSSSYLPSRYNLKDYRSMIPTYFMIQDAVRNMDSVPNARIYKLVMQISVASEREFTEFLLQRGYDPKEFIGSLEIEHRIPENMDTNDFDDLRWQFEGIECGDFVMLFDLSGRVGSMSEVQKSKG